MTADTTPLTVRAGSFVHDIDQCEGVGTTACPLAILAFAIQRLGSLQAAVDDLDPKILQFLDVFPEDGAEPDLSYQLSYFELPKLPVVPRRVVCTKNTTPGRPCGLVVLRGAKQLTNDLLKV